MADFHVIMRSNAAPFFSDEDTIYLSAETPLEALAQARAGYKHPRGLYAAGVHDSKGRMVARYLSARAHTSTKAACGLMEWRGDRLYASGVLQPSLPELVEEVATAAPPAGGER